MFDFERAIAEWREQMLTAGIKTPVPLEELEAHLREEMQRQARSCASDEQAFQRAAELIGKASALHKEFKKFRGASSMMEKLKIGICLVFMAFIVLLGSATVVCCFSNWGDRVIAATAMACSILVPCIWRYVIPFLPMMTSARKRWTAGLACIACGFIASSFYCNIILPRFEISPDHQVPAIGFFAVFLIGTFSCAGLGLMMNQQQREKLGVRKFSFDSPAAADR